jgi:hypothetical protein
MRRRWWLVVSALLIVAGLSWWVAQVTLLEPGERSDASGYGQFVLAVVGLLMIVGGWIVKGFNVVVVSPDLDRLTDALALAMRNQWQDAANERQLLQYGQRPSRSGWGCGEEISSCVRLCWGAEGVGRPSRMLWRPVMECHSSVAARARTQPTHRACPAPSSQCSRCLTAAKI